MKIPEPRKLPSGSWFIQLRLGGESISITETDQDMCIARAMALKTGLIKAKKQPSDKTLGAAVDEYIENRKNLLSPSTIKAYRAYRSHRFASLMERKLSTITPKLVQSSVNAEIVSPRIASGSAKSSRSGATVSAKTVINAYGLIRTVLTMETDIDLSRITLPQKPVSNGVTLTPEQIGQLINTVDGDLIEIPILLAVWLTLRRSEIAALEKSDFDFVRKTVTVKSALVQDENNNWVEKLTKNRTSTRVLSCPDYILSRVQSLPDGRILTVNPNTLYSRLQILCSRAGLPQIRFHDLRHCAASVMLLLGVPDKYAMERGGWASKQTMTGRYQHTIDSAAQSINDTINNYYYSLLNNDNANENANAIE